MNTSASTSCEGPTAFSLRGFLRGAGLTVPLALASAANGVVFGVLAGHAGLEPLEALLMSGLVFSGAAQFVSLELWGTPVPVVALVWATLLVNFRYVLMGASLRPLLSGLSPSRIYIAAYFLTDESWALTSHDMRAGHRDAAFLLGSGALMLVGWTAGTAVGAAIGAGSEPERLLAWGLDFVFLAVFVGLLAGFWRGRGDIVPWAFAAAAALLASVILPGTWYVLAGGLAGTIAGGMLHEH